MVKILIILGNTKKKSFCRELADSYERGAKSGGHLIKRINIGDLKFDPVLWEGDTHGDNLEPDLIKAQKSILWAEHIVLFYPVWWMNMPAIVKGFMDRVFTSGFAYKFYEGKPFPERFLKGRSARLILTMDNNPFIYKIFFGNPGSKSIKKGVFLFCGICPTRVSKFGSVRKASDEKRKKWLAKVNRWGIKAK